MCVSVCLGQSDVCVCVLCGPITAQAQRYGVLSEFSTGCTTSMLATHSKSVCVCVCVRLCVGVCVRACVCVCTCAQERAAALGWVLDPRPWRCEEWRRGGPKCACK